MSFVPPFDPNGPFFWPETNAVAGPSGPLIIGAGLSVTRNGDLIAIGGGPAVTYLAGGTGIHLSGNTGNVTITNVGVTDVLAGTGIGLVKSGGVVTITNTAPAVSLGGTVTSVATGTGLTGGPISTSGTISLANTGVAAATYTNPTITVNAQGQITFATNGGGLSSISGTAPVVVTGGANAIVSVNQASPTIPGVVFISDSVVTTSSNTAASSTAVKNAYDLATAALPCSLLTGQGDLISSSGSGTPLRVPAGAEGSYLKVCAACSGTAGLTWDTVAISGGTVTSVTAGAGLTGGTITGAGTIALDSSCVISPATLPSKGAILSASAASTPLALGLGSNGQYLTVNTSCLTGLEWVNAPAAIPCSAFNVKGDILVGTAPGFYAALPVGGNGEVLTACSLCTAGVTWVASASDAMPTTGGTFTGDVAFYGGVLGGTILTLGNLVPGGGYDFGAYFNVTLTGGTGVGATADISVGFDGGVADVTLVNPGTGYTVGDSLTAFSTFGTPWSILVDTVTVGVPGATIIDGVGSCGTAGQVLTSNGFNALCWRSLSAATPTVAGIVKGFINATNTALGCNAAVSLTTGLSNTALGTSAGAALTDGCCNTFIGNSAGCSATFALGQTIIGARAGNTLTSGFYNVFVGAEAGASATQSRNVFIGACAGCAQTTGSSNVAIGDGVNVPVTTAGCQLAIGYSSSATCWLTGNFTGAIKPGKGIIDCANSCGTTGQVLASTGANAICWTSLPGVATSSTLGTVYGQPGSFGNNLVSYGYGALGLGAGERMTAFGKNALPQVSEFACDNNAFGYNAFPNLTFGNRNTGIGGGSFGFGTTLTTGNNNTVIGNGADVAAAGSSNSITLGNSSITVIRAQVTTITALSDARDKTNVTALPVGLDFIKSLNPVKFTWQMREPNEVKDGTSEAGFIAQELQEAQEKVNASDYLGLVYDENPEKLEAAPGKLVPVLVKAIQELCARVEELESKQSN